ncbi:MAG: VOC family protein [Cryobacterium sp.]|nr:VOC family protein [Cryobacterium sp.]
MKTLKQMVVFDAADLEAESAFWAGLLDGTVDRDEDWHTVLIDGRPQLAVQLAPNHIRPQWPNGQPQQIHLDLYVEDPQAAEEEALALGAKLLKPAYEFVSESGFRVYEDPAGHPFCFCWGHD